MATSGTVQGNSVDGDPGVYVDWQLATQDFSGYSIITWQSGWKFDAVGCRGLRLGLVIIDGVVVYDDNDPGDGVHGFVSGHNHRPRLQTASGSLQLAHDANGQKNFTIQCEMYGWAGGPVRSSGSGSFSLPQIPQPPASPSGASATRVNDGQINISWTNNDTGIAPYANIKVYRRTDGGSWVNIATLGVVESYSDTTVSANHKYQYRISAVGVNPVEVGYATTSAVYTTPAAPTIGSATKLANGNIRLSWANNVSYGDNAYTTRIEESQDGGAFAEIASVAAGVTTWDHVAPDTGVTHRYRVRARSTVGSLNSAYSATSNTITLLSTAAAPTGLSPSGVARDAADAVVLSWIHNPTDGTPQSKRHVQVKVNGGSYADLVNDASTASSYTVPGGTWTNGDTITWRVATAGENGTLGPFSAEASFTLSAKPTVTINEPGTTYDASTLTVTWGYFQAQSSPQASWQASLFDNNGLLIETISGTTETEGTFTATVADGGTYTVTVIVTSAAGLTSIEDSQEFTVTYLPPAAIAIAGAFDNTVGAMVLTLTGEAEQEGVTVPIVTVDVQRQINGGEWVTILTGVVLDPVTRTAIVQDTVPITVGTNTYRAIAYSALPSSVMSAEAAIVVNETTWGYLSGGTRFGTVARFHAMPTYAATTSRAKALYHFAGRPKPVQLAGEALTATLTVSGRLSGDSSTAAEFEALGQAEGVVCWRGPDGRRMFGSIDKVSTSTTRLKGQTTVSFSVTELDFTEGDQ